MKGIIPKNYAELGQLIPELLKHKNEDLEMIVPIIDYSGEINSPDKALFLKAIDGLSDEVILRKRNVTQMVILGLKKFGFEERSENLEEKAAKTTAI